MNNKYIFIVEDDRFAADAYEKKLRQAGFHIVVCPDVTSLYDQLYLAIPTLIILDIVLPNKNGFTILKELKEKPQYANIPVLIVSNLNQKEDIDRGIQLGAIDYLVKTEVSLNDLVEKIKSFLALS